MRRANPDLNSKDATTNPTLLLAAANKPQYAHLVDSAIQYGRSKGGTVHDQACLAMDRLVGLYNICDSDTTFETFCDANSWSNLGKRF